MTENGATLYQPVTQVEETLAPAPSEPFIELLKQRGVPVSVGRTIVATVQPYENVVLQTIRDLGLELQVIFNKGSVMILPTAVNKATGLMAALSALEATFRSRSSESAMARTITRCSGRQVWGSPCRTQSHC